MKDLFLKKNKRILKTAAVILIWTGLWFLAADIMGMELLIPSPSVVFKTLIVLLKQKSFYLSCLTSLLRVLAGWTIGVLSGTLLGVITYISSALNTFFEPLLHLIKATPVASFIVLALVLMKSGSVPIFTCALITAPILWTNIYKGLDSPDKKIKEMADFFGMSKRKKIYDIYFPAVLPYFSSAAITSMGLSWKAAVAAEVICTPSGSIGAGIADAKVYLETPSLFAWTAVVILLSFIMEKLLGLLLKKLEEYYD